MKVFLISLFVATLASATFANAIPPNETSIVDELTVFETNNVNSTKNGNTDIGEAITELLTSFKKAMPCGNPSLGLPPMSPFRLPSVNVNFTGEHLSLKGKIDNLVIDGLDNFLIIKLATNKTNNRTEIDMLYKDIQVLGKFDLSVEANVAGLKYVQPIKGYINFQLLNIRDSSAFTIGQTEAGGVQISDYEYSSQIGDIKVNSLNTEWSVAVNNFANQYIRDFSMLFLQTHREMIGKMYAVYATPAANKVLAEVSFDTLVTTIDGFSQLLKSAKCKQ